MQCTVDTVTVTLHRDTCPAAFTYVHPQLLIGPQRFYQEIYMIAVDPLQHMVGLLDDTMCADALSQQVILAYCICCSLMHF